MTTPAGASRLRLVRDFSPILMPQRTASGEWCLEQIDEHRPAWRIVAMHGRHVIGALSYEHVCAGLLGVKSWGTFVSRSYRRLGLASRLWAEMLRLERPRRVYVQVASDRGLTLIESLRRRHPRVDWKVSEAGDRKLRRLAQERAA